MPAKNEVATVVVATGRIAAESHLSFSRHRPIRQTGGGAFTVSLSEMCMGMGTQDEKIGMGTVHVTVGMRMAQGGSRSRDWSASL